MKKCTLILLALVLFKCSNGQQDLLDNSYGINGRAIVDFLDRDESRSTAIDASDRLLIAGTHLFTSNSDLYVCRLSTDGEVDETFAANGPTPGFFHYIPESSVGRLTPPIIRVLNSGEIIVGMSFITPIANTASNELLTYIFCLNNNGTLNAAFGENGMAMFSGASVISDICEGNDGDIILANELNPLSNFKQTSLARISANGQLIEEDFAEEAIEFIGDPYFSFYPNKIIFSEGELVILSTAVLPNPNYPSYPWYNQKYLVVWKVSLDNGQLLLDYGTNGSFTHHIVDDSDISDVVSYVVGDAVLNNEENLLVTLISYGGTSTPGQMLKIDSDGLLRSDFADGGILTFDYPSSSCNKFSMFAKHPSYGYYVMSYNVGVLDNCESGTISICQVSDEGTPLFLEGTEGGSIEIEESFTVHLPRLQVQTDGKLLLTSFYFPYQENNETDIKTIRIHTDQVSLVENQMSSAEAFLTAYPNPTTDQLRIKLTLPDGAAQGNRIELVIHDLQGRVVYRQNHPELQLSETAINVTNFETGLYTLHCIINGVWVDSEKVVVE
jgi:hypothetical protein